MFTDVSHSITKLIDILSEVTGLSLYSQAFLIPISGRSWVFLISEMNRAGHCWRCEAPCSHDQQCSRCRVAFCCSKECQKRDKWRHEPDCDDAVSKTECSGCGGEHEGMKKCSNCLEGLITAVSNVRETTGHDTGLRVQTLSRKRLKWSNG